MTLKSTPNQIPFLKYEHLYYPTYNPVEIPEEYKNGEIQYSYYYEAKSFYQLLVWNKDSMIYYDDDNGNLLELSENNPEDLKKHYASFFSMVEKWDTTQMAERQFDRSLVSPTYIEPSILVRIVFRDGHGEFEYFKFKDFRFGNDFIKIYITRLATVIKLPSNYNAIIEDILFYRHTDGLPYNMSEKRKEQMRELAKEQIEKFKINPETEAEFFIKRTAPCCVIENDTTIP